MHPPRSSVLVVDSHAASRATYARWLSQAGFRCLTAAGHESALWLARRVSPGVAVVSLAPGQDDSRIAAALHTTAPDLPVVLLGGPRSGAAGAAPAGPPLHRAARPAAPAELVAAVRCAASGLHVSASAACTRRRAALAAIAARQERLQASIAGVRYANLAYHALLRTFGERVPPLFAHSARVAVTAAAMATRLDLPHRQRDEITGAALLHDIGKLALPEAVLCGVEPLEELHVEALGDAHGRTLQMLDAAPALAPVVHLLTFAGAWWDGTGSPDGLHGAAIPLEARILAVADALDAPGIRRGSPSGDPRRTALAAAAGSRLDPDLVRVGLHALESPACS